MCLNTSRGLNKCLVYATAELRMRFVATQNRFKAPSPHPTPPPVFAGFFFFFTDRSKAVFLLWCTISVNVCVLYMSWCFLFLDGRWANFGGRNCPFCFLLVVFLLWCRCFKCVLLSPWCLGRKVLGNCIDSWSLPSFLLNRFAIEAAAILYTVLRRQNGLQLLKFCLNFIFLGK